MPKFLVQCFFISFYSSTFSGSSESPSRSRYFKSRLLYKMSTLSKSLPRASGSQGPHRSRSSGEFVAERSFISRSGLVLSCTSTRTRRSSRMYPVQRLFFNERPTRETRTTSFTKCSGGKFLRFCHNFYSAYKHAIKKKRKKT